MSSRTDSFFIRPKRRGLGIEMAPLIDIVFLLLIFFMLNTTFSNPAIPLVIPQSTNDEGDVHESEVVVVSADAQGKIYINREEVAWEDYQEALGEAMEELNMKSVHFKGDKNLSYGEYMKIFEATQASGAVVFKMVRRAMPSEEDATPK